MSRIGIQPIPLPAGVTVAVEGATVRVRGPKGELSWTAPADLRVSAENGVVSVTRNEGGDDVHRKALHGTARSLIANMVRGVAEGYRKELEIQGVGYKAALQGRTLVLNLGKSHEDRYEAPAGVTIAVAEGTQIVVSGPDKQAVGEAAARIRAFAKAEPYKGKGVRYKGEHVRRKAGKTVA